MYAIIGDFAARQGERLNYEDVFDRAGAPIRGTVDILEEQP